MRFVTTLALITLVSPGSASAAGGVAVVELFTSEGCSSCPPADAVLSRIRRESEARGDRVLLLGYHVDYWDRLGWPDRFAHPAYTRRQRRYADALSAGRMYTPQMVVDGVTQFVGADGRKADEAIAAALAEPGVAMRLGLAWDAGGDSVTLRTTPPGHWAALVEDGVQTDVRAGENAGRTLRHDAVVRELVELDVRGYGRLRLPADADRASLSVVAWAQPAPTTRIVGGARRALTPKASAPSTSTSRTPDRSATPAGGKAGSGAAAP